jgi:hypothetical protein
MHTHVVMQADSALGLTLHHHPRQQHGYHPLSAAHPEDVHDGLIDGEPAVNNTLCVMVKRHRECIDQEGV